jgi:hypothetical protein
MYLELDCDCGNPACSGELFVRRGYVHIRHPDGREEERWDYLHIDVKSGVGDDSKMVQLMLTPEDGRAALWWFTKNYMPVLHNLITAYYRVRVWALRGWFDIRRRITKPQ